MPNVDWVPTVSDVGAQLRARTKDRNGNELGTFTPDTRPTNTQVAVLANQAVGDVQDVVGDDLPVELYDRARSVAALGAALLVELTYFPEQVATGRSPYEQLRALYEDRLARLAASASAAGDPDASDVAGSLHPAGGFRNGPVEYPPPQVTVPISRIDYRTNW